MRHEDDALEESTRFFSELTPPERGWLKEIRASAEAQSVIVDAKTQQLLDWIEEHLRPGGRWNRERLIIFTEYKHTLDYLKQILEAQGWSDHLTTLIGGMNLTDRETIKAAFQTSPAENPVRILLATDAASEGLNLQNYCRYLIHWEIPWNPNRMEQRNGRIDRHGQKAAEVFVHHFVYRNHEDTQFLQTVIDKVQTMREDLGSIGEVIAAQVEEAMLGRRTSLDLPTRRVELAKAEVKADVLTEQRIRELSQRRLQAQRDLELYPDNLRRVLHEALRLQGHAGLEPITDGELTGKAYRLTNLPPSWRDGEQAIRDEKGRLLALTFDHHVATGRKDVTIIHLNHPLMKRAMGVFRSNLWSQGFGTGPELARAAYRVLPAHLLNVPLIVAFGRVVATSELSQKIHEGLIAVGGEIHQQELPPIADDLLRDLLKEDGVEAALPRDVAKRLQSFFPVHEKQLMALLAQREKDERKRLAGLLQKKAGEETKAIDALMRDRIKELEKRLMEREKEAAGYQLSLFGDEAEQFEEDTDWLQRKREHLLTERAVEPERIKQRYTLRGVRVFPLGILYLLPETVLH